MAVPTLSYANVMATIAVFVSLGGGAYAVTSATGSRTSGVIRACVDRRTGELRITRAARRCHASERAVSWNRRGRTGPAGAPGRDGADGRDGQNGAQGPPGATNVVTRTGGPGTGTAHCNAGEVAVGGGGDAAGGQLTVSRPDPATGTPTGWMVNNTGTPFVPQAYVVCAAP